MLKNVLTGSVIFFKLVLKLFLQRKFVDILYMQVQITCMSLFEFPHCDKTVI